MLGVLDVGPGSLWTHFGPTGTGKTTIAANLACQLLRSGHPVVLSSADSPESVCSKGGLTRGPNLYWCPRSLVLSDDPNPDFIQFLHQQGNVVAILDDIQPSTPWLNVKRFALRHDVPVVATYTPRRRLGDHRPEDLPTTALQYADVITIPIGNMYFDHGRPGGIDLRVIKHRTRNDIIRFHFPTRPPLTPEEVPRLNRYQLLMSD